MEHVGSHRSGHSSKGRIDKLIYSTACESTLHQSLPYIQYAKIFTESRFSNFHLVGYPVALSHLGGHPLFFAFPRRIFRTIWAWRYTNSLALEESATATHNWSCGGVA